MVWTLFFPFNIAPSREGSKKGHTLTPLTWDDITVSPTIKICLHTSIIASTRLRKCICLEE